MQTRSRPLLIPLAAALAAFAAFLPSVRFAFVNYDDPVYVTENPVVPLGLSPDAVLWAVFSVSEASWHPLTWLSLLLDATLWGVDPFGFHLTNVLLHAGTTGLVAAFAGRLGCGPVAALLAALAWGLHPLRVEAVAWVGDRTDLLCGFFWVLACLGYLRHTERPTRGRWRLVVASFALAGAAKPVAVTLPFALMLLDAWPLGRLRSWRDLWPLVREKDVLWLVTAAVAGLTVYARGAGGSIAGLDEVSPAGRLSGAAVGYAAHLRMTAFPVDLAVMYPLPPGGRSPAEGLAAAGPVAALTAAAVAVRRRAPGVLFGWLWFLGTLVPMIGLVQVGRMAYCDRYTYIPHVGLFAGVAASVAPLAVGRRRWPALAAAAAGVVALAALTERQLGHWRDSGRLWGQAIRVVPNNPAAWHMLARHRAAEKDWPGVLAAEREAARLDPDNLIYQILTDAAELRLRGAGGSAPAPGR